MKSTSTLMFTVLLMAATFVTGCGSQKNQSPIPTNNGYGIVGGEPVQIGDPIAQSTVALYADLSSGGKMDFFNFCTGTLIAKDLVITAAHCVVDFSNELHTNPDGLKRLVKIGFGLPVVDTPQSTQLVFRGIKNIKANEAYVMGEVDKALMKPFMDIALIQLDQPAPDSARPAALPTSANMLTHGMNITIAGFGLTDGRFKTDAVRMNKVTIQVDNENATASQFTYKVVNSKSACNGDSGGPAYLVSPYGQLTVVGVTSWGDGNCTRFGAYTKVSAFVSWLAQTASYFHSQN